VPVWSYSADMEIHKKALALIRVLGDRGSIHAAMEADARLEAGDLDGAGQWRMVPRVIRKMKEPKGADALTSGLFRSTAQPQSRR
jgi:hypothetical protein